MSTLMTPTDYVTLPVSEADHQFSYGPDESQFGDVFLPAQQHQSASALLLLHGGCWQHAFGLAPLAQLARALTDLGVVVCNLEYRRIGGGGGWPSTFQDVLNGGEAFLALAEQLQFDPQRLVVAGHSAGGHLALWMGGRWRLATDSDIRGVHAVQPRAIVSLAGIGDLVGALSGGICRGAPAELLGGSDAVHPERYAQASPKALLPLMAPHWHIVGAHDALVPALHVRQFVTNAQAAGDRVALTEIDNAGHFEIVTATSHAWPAVKSVFSQAVASV